MKKVMKLVWAYFKKLDKFLLCAVLSCSVLSILLLYSIYLSQVSNSVYPSTYQTQIIASGLGLICAIILSLIDYSKLVKMWYLYAPVALIMVALTFTGLGMKREGTSADDQAWLDLGFTSIQPSEFLKIAFILTFAYHCSKVKDKVNQPVVLGLLCLHAAVPIGLVSLQGDQGTAIVFAFIFFAMLFSAGLSWKYVASAILALPVFSVLAWNFLLQGHHKNRIMIMFNPEADPLGDGFQQLTGKVSLGSGQLLGKGLFGGEYCNVAEIHNDFIFSWIGQTLGFVGCAIFMAVLMFIMLKLVYNSFLANDFTGQLICIGVFAMIFIHTVLNVGMVLLLMPVIGVPLPFVSAGGTSVVAMYLAVGLALSVYSQNKKFNSLFS